MFSWFGGGVFGDLAGEALEHAVSALFDLAPSGRGAVGCSGVALFEGVLVVRHC
jgi:hypothetical protein